MGRAGTAPPSPPPAVAASWRRGGGPGACPLPVSGSLSSTLPRVVVLGAGAGPQPQERPGRGQHEGGNDGTGAASARPGRSGPSWTPGTFPSSCVCSRSAASPSAFCESPGIYLQFVPFLPRGHGGTITSWQPRSSPCLGPASPFSCRDATCPGLSVHRSSHHLIVIPTTAALKRAGSYRTTGTCPDEGISGTSFNLHTIKLQHMASGCGNSQNRKDILVWVIFPFISVVILAS